MPIGASDRRILGVIHGGDYAAIAHLLRMFIMHIGRPFAIDMADDNRPQHSRSSKPTSIPFP
jgi:hypothetical protein